MPLKIRRSSFRTVPCQVGQGKAEAMPQPLPSPMLNFTVPLTLGPSRGGQAPARLRSRASSLGADQSSKGPRVAADGGQAHRLPCTARSMDTNEEGGRAAARFSRYGGTAISACAGPRRRWRPSVRPSPSGRSRTGSEPRRRRWSRSPGRWGSECRRWRWRSRRRR